MRFRRTTMLSLGCLSVLVGLGMSRKLFIDIDRWLILFAPSLLLLRNKNLASLLLIILIGLLLGLWRGGIYMQKLAELKTHTAQKVTLELSAKTDAVYGSRAQIEFTGSNIELIHPEKKPLASNAKISGFGVPMVYRGDRVEVTGKLYPMRGSNQIRIAYAQLKIVGAGNSWFDKLTRIFSTGMENALPEPQASFGLGLLVGQRTNLPADVVAQLTMVGLVHIVAVSGYNLTILVRSAQRLRLKSKYQILLLSLGLILSFILVTGFSASIVRAAVVSILGLWAWYYGRQLKAVLVIAFAAALTAMFNPFYVWTDIGWYLSFLAFFGVLVISPLIVKQFFKRPPQLLTMVLIETLCAEIMTLPLIMMIFGQMSLVALLANLLVVPLIPAAMLLAAVAAAAGAIMPLYAGWFAWPARYLLTYILDLVNLLASIPRIFIHLTISPTLMISLYVLVIALIVTIHRKLNSKPGTNTLGVIK